MPVFLHEITDTLKFYSSKLFVWVRIIAVIGLGVMIGYIIDWTKSWNEKARLHAEQQKVKHDDNSDVHLNE